MSAAVHSSTDIRAFHIDNYDKKVDDLRRRIGATRWQTTELFSTEVRAAFKPLL